MHEKLVIVPKRKTMEKKILTVVFFILTCICLVLAMISPVIFMVPAILFGVLWYVLSFKSYVEFEYTYYDGELRFAKIKNKNRRKNLARVELDDVLGLAPKGDRSMYKYENDKNITYKNLTSREPAARIYELVCKGEKGFTRYEFEPDEVMLDEIMIKYPRLVIK